MANGKVPATPSASGPATGTKRKRMDTPSVYAVRIGLSPGVYHSWDACFRQIKGVKNATFKKFSTVADAEAFVQGTPVNNTSSSTPQKFYAVRSGRVPGIYTDWSSALKQVSGVQKPVHKSFLTRAEAEAFLKGEAFSPQHRDSSTPNKSKKTKKNGQAAATSEPDENIPPGTGPLPADSTDGFDPRIRLNPESGKVEYKDAQQRNATKMMPTGVADDAAMRVYTDGSALKNGAYGAIAGIGVYFGSQDIRNLSEPLPGGRQTNQRAELTAVKRALDIVPMDREVTIITDSRYAIDCLTKWHVSWRKNGWQTAEKKPVENKDIIEPILDRIEERLRFKATTDFEWIKGHAADHGNIAADHLAVSAARQARGTTTEAHSSNSP